MLTDDLRDGGRSRHRQRHQLLPDDPNHVFSGNVHATYHMWDANNAGIVKIGTAHDFLCHRHLAQVLTKMDSKDFLEPNGETVLDNNSLELVSSEVGTNDDVKRMFHGIAGGNAVSRWASTQTTASRPSSYTARWARAYGLAKVSDGRDYKTDNPTILA